MKWLIDTKTYKRIFSIVKALLFIFKAFILKQNFNKYSWCCFVISKLNLGGFAVGSQGCTSQG